MSDVGELDVDGLRALQAVYDSLAAERKKVIDAYDALHDGDVRKTELLRQMDELGAKIRKVEDEFDKVIDGEVNAVVVS